MISALGRKLSGWSERYVPDPFVFALILTLLTLVLALVFGRAVEGLAFLDRLAVLGGGVLPEALAGDGKKPAGWFDSFYGSKGLMKFALQMCIVLITGHALALSGPVRRLIAAFTRIAATPKMAVAVVAMVACAASLVQWGLGAIAGAFMAREMGRAFAEQGRAVHYPLLGAAGYAGFLVWHGGLSGSAPLKVAEEGHHLAAKIGVIPIDQTLFSTLNLTVTGSLLILIPLVFWLLMPDDEADMVGFGGFNEADEAAPSDEEDRRAKAVVWLESTPLLNIVVALTLLTYIAYFFYGKGVAGWNLDSINLIFLTLGIALHRSPVAYVAAVADGVKGCAGIILQFPFYFGILGILKASGLIEQIGEWFVAISGPTTFPIFTFISAGLVNFLVPSGGGQWAVQGPVMLEAIDRLSVAPEKIIMALSYGDAWTNMLQPFWALPLLGIMGLRARDIIGYTAFLMLVTGPVIMFWLLIL